MPAEWSTEEIDAAYSDGVRARLDGFRRNQNPYATCTPMCKAWDNGWRSASEAP